MKKLICALLLVILPSVCAQATELTLNEKSGLEVSGTVLTTYGGEYEPVLLRVENENGDTIYMDQLYTDTRGQASFSFIHNPNKSGYGTMTVYAKSAGETDSATYNVDEAGADKYLSVECIDITSDAEFSSMQYKISNSGITSRDVYVITAVYNENALDYVVSDTITVKYGTPITDTISIPYTLDRDIKTFVWDVQTLRPYSAPIEWKEAVPQVIRVEAECGETSDFTPQYLSGEGVSGTLLHLWKGAFDPDADYTVTYNVNCAAAGIYDLTAVVSNFEEGYTADCFVAVNNEEPVHSSDAEFKEDVTIGVSGLEADLLNKYSFGKVKLNKGTNTLTLNIEGKNWLNNSVVFEVDYFELVPVVATATMATLKARNATLNIFEEQDGVTFDLLLDGVATDDSEVSYTISNYFGTVCESGKVTVSNGSYRESINVADMPTGWYELDVTGTLIDDTVAFAVVPDGSKRTGNVYNPFAIDLATSHLTDSHYEQRQYAKAAKLAGADWTRDRFNWAELEAKEGTYNYNYIKGDTDTLKDAGLNVTETFSTAPLWAKNSGETLPKTPNIMYNLIANASAGLEGFVDVWEIWNEQDAYQFSKEGADHYAALFKAAAIAADNADVDPMIALGGLCTTIDSSGYNHLLFQNGVMDYLDIYNYHTHLTYEAAEGDVPAPQKDKMQMYRVIADLYGIGDKPIWQTESGIRQFIENGKAELTELQCIAQAQHIVPAYLEAIASGVDKQFMFIGVPYIEGGADFGVFDANGEPRPAYAVQAVMTKMLEGTTFLGNVHSLPTGVCGYAMQNDSKVIQILWGTTQTAYTIDSKAQVYDVMGNLLSQDTVTLSGNPMYFVYDKSDAPNNVYERPSVFNEPKKTEFTDADKIVLFAEYPVVNTETDKTNGYSLSYADDNTVSVTVYNFSDTDMSGTLTAVAENGSAFDIVCPTEPLTVSANKTATVDLVLKSNANTVFGATYDFVISGTFGGAEISPYAAWVSFDRDIESFTKLNAADKITGDGWQAPGKTDNFTGSISIASDGIKFDVTSDGNGGYYYPFTFTRTQNLSLYDGMTLSVWFDKTVEKSIENYMTIQISNSNNATFTLATSELIPIKEGWNNYSFKWSDFSKKVSGTAADIHSILSTRMYVRIGVQTTQTALSYKLADVGLFTAGEKTALPEIIAVADRNDDTISITATLPEGVSGARVLYDGENMTYIVSGSEIFATVDNVADGNHKLTVIAYTQTGKAIYKQIDV